MFKKTDKYDNFVPTDIFKKDKKANDVYFQWGKFGNGYIIDNQIKKDRLFDLEGYKHFFLSYRALIFIPMIVFAYITTISIYFMKISKVTKGCRKVSKDEKKWILQNV